MRGKPESRLQIHSHWRRRSCRHGGTLHMYDLRSTCHDGVVVSILERNEAETLSTTTDIVRRRAAGHSRERTVRLVSVTDRGAHPEGATFAPGHIYIPTTADTCPLYLTLAPTIGGFKGGQGGHAPPRRTWPLTSSGRGHAAPLECKKTF